MRRRFIGDTRLGALVPTLVVPATFVAHGNPVNESAMSDRDFRLSKDVMPARYSLRIEDILVCEEGGGRNLNSYPAALVANG